MKLFILGIGGTFMSALALIARDLGYDVSGCDKHVYPPVSDLLHNKGVHWIEGYEACDALLDADHVVVGNAMKRGIEIVEQLLNANIPYSSGPEWLSRHVLAKRHVMAVAGTHGKTTVTSMLAWILHEAGLEPGFLIGGVSCNFQTSGRLGKGDYFVIEADEYDSAFFDKRPKFLHYKPRVAILNNLEFDHADIYDNLDAIKKQFVHLTKTVPSNGLLIHPKASDALADVCQKAHGTKVQTTTVDGLADWSATMSDPSGMAFAIYHKSVKMAEIDWSILGDFNVENALCAFAAAYSIGVEPCVAANALMSFKPVQRRLQKVHQHQNITLYDDFAHHPTAIGKTIAALHASGMHKRILVVLEFGSYSMRHGVHLALMGDNLVHADRLFALQPDNCQLDDVSKQWPCESWIGQTSAEIAQAVCETAQEGDCVLLLSNRGMDNFCQRLINLWLH